MLRFWCLFFFIKIWALWWSRFKNFLNPHWVNLSVCLFNILFGYNFRKNRTMTMKFWYVFELHKFALYMKKCYCVVLRSFYRSLQKFQYINISCSFLTTQIGTKLARFLNYIEKFYVPKLIILSSIYCFAEYFKNLNTFTVLF